MSPKLSILMGSVGDRLERMCGIYGKISSQAAPFHPNVEIVVMTDNRCRSIGLKRQALLDVARGEYVCYVDDDDDVADVHVQSLYEAVNQFRADVFVFPTLCISDQYGTIRVDHSVGFENEDVQVEGFRRKPWWMHPICRELAVSSVFTDSNWGEDADWLGPLWKKMLVEFEVTEEPLYYYNWEDAKPNPDKPDVGHTGESVEST